jgi:hypothetical protein
LAGAAAPGLAAQQQQGLVMDVSMDATSEQPTQQQQQLSIALPGQQQQQHVSGHPPLCPHGPHMVQHGHVRSEAEMRRTSSVIAMMQVTVTEALGFN